MIPFDQATLITPFADEKADPGLSALPEFIPLVQDQRPECRDFWPNAFPARAALPVSVLRQVRRLGCLSEEG